MNTEQIIIIFKFEILRITHNNINTLLGRIEMIYTMFYHQVVHTFLELRLQYRDILINKIRMLNSKCNTNAIFNIIFFLCFCWCDLFPICELFCSKIK